MSNASIISILNDHGISYMIDTGMVHAKEVSVYRDGTVCTKWVNVYNWSKHKLMVWLGY